MLPPYCYRPLEPGHIRLLHILDNSDPNEIKCSLVHESHDEAKHEYTALSYCWGDPEPVAAIRIDGRRIDIARNLWDFLQNWRRDSYPYEALWIDAICLNQKDFKEKSTQVQIMWRIYEDAGFVVAWLGWCDESLRDALSVLEGLGDDGEGHPMIPGFVRMSMEQLEDRIVRQHGQRVEEVLNDLARLTENEYFERMWTYQEIVNSAGTNVCFDFGVRRCKWRDLCALDASFRWIGGDEQRPKLAAGLSGMCMGWLFGWKVRYLRSHSLDGQINSYESMSVAAVVLDHAIMTTRTQQCLDPRDRIFAILGLPDVRLRADSIQLFADYSMTTSELWAVVISRYECLRFKEMQRTPDDTAVKAAEEVLRFSYQVFTSLGLRIIYPELKDAFIWVRNRSHKDPRGHASSFPRSSGDEIVLSESWFFNHFLNNSKIVWQRADGDWPWHGGEAERVDFAEVIARIKDDWT